MHYVMGKFSLIYSSIVKKTGSLLLGRKFLKKFVRTAYVFWLCSSPFPQLQACICGFSKERKTVWMNEQFMIMLFLFYEFWLADGSIHRKPKICNLSKVFKSTAWMDQTLTVVCLLQRILPSAWILSWVLNIGFHISYHFPTLRMKFKEASQVYVNSLVW